MRPAWTYVRVFHFGSNRFLPRLPPDVNKVLTKIWTSTSPCEFYLMSEDTDEITDMSFNRILYAVTDVNIYLCRRLLAAATRQDRAINIADELPGRMVEYGLRPVHEMPRPRLYDARTHDTVYFSTDVITATRLIGSRTLDDLYDNIRDTLDRTMYAVAVSHSVETIKNFFYRRVDELAAKLAKETGLSRHEIELIARACMRSPSCENVYHIGDYFPRNVRPVAMAIIVTAAYEALTRGDVLIDLVSATGYIIEDGDMRRVPAEKILDVKELAELLPERDSARLRELRRQ